MGAAVPAAVRIRILASGKLARLAFLWISTFAWLGVKYMRSSESPGGSGLRATATVTRVEPIEIDGRTRFEHYYSFTDASGALRSTSSISRHLVSVGPHLVEYDPRHPSHALLVDASDHKESAREKSALFFWLFVALGFALLLFALRAPRRTLRFLRRSKPGIARITGVSRRSKWGKVWTKLAFEYDDGDTLRTGAVERRHIPRVDVYKRLGIRFLSDQVMTQVELPYGAMTANGELTGRDGTAWMFAFIPAIALSGVAVLMALTLVAFVR